MVAMFSGPSYDLYHIPISATYGPIFHSYIWLEAHKFLLGKHARLPFQNYPYRIHIHEMVVDTNTTKLISNSFTSLHLGGTLKSNHGLGEQIYHEKVTNHFSLINCNMSTLETWPHPNTRKHYCETGVPCLYVWQWFYCFCPSQFLYQNKN